MYAFFEQGIRGGISVIGHRFWEANNKYLEDYDERKPSSFIKYDDVNNLYGAAMSELLPYCDFEWMTRTEMDNIDLSSIPAGAYEVDLEYPKDLHDLHNAYPMAL